MMENEIEDLKKTLSRSDKHLKEAEKNLKKIESDLKSKQEEVEALKRPVNLEPDLSKVLRIYNIKYCFPNIILFI